jgi:hypothetical protein
MKLPIRRHVSLPLHLENIDNANRPLYIDLKEIADFAACNC